MCTHVSLSLLDSYGYVSGLETHREVQNSSLFAVSRIALVKPDKAEAVQNLCIQMAQRGQISEKVGFPNL